MIPAPVIYEGDTILLDKERMDVGYPYPILWRGEPAVAILQLDGSVVIGRLATPPEP